MNNVMSFIIIHKLSKNNFFYYPENKLVGKKSRNKFFTSESMESDFLNCTLTRM